MSGNSVLIARENLVRQLCLQAENYPVHPYIRRLTMMPGSHGHPHLYYPLSLRGESEDEGSNSSHSIK